MAQLQLWVDNEDSTGAWSTVGSPPYLGSQDEPNNYIYSTGRNSISGVYSFQGTGETGSITSVYLYIYAYGVATSDFEAYLGASATGLGPPAGSWQWMNVEVTSILTTWSAINAATVYFDRPNTQNDAGVDACYILVNYEGEIAPSVSDTVSVSDTPTIGRLDCVSIVADSVNVSDSPTARVSNPVVSVSDTVNASDTPTAQVTLGPSVSDAVGVTDAPAAQVSDPQVSVSDATSVTDTPTLAGLGPVTRTVNVSDAVNVLDTATARLTALELDVTDAVGVVDDPTASLLLAVLTVDSVAVADDPTVEVEAEPPREVTVSDAVSVSDSVIVDPLVAALVVSDTVTVTDAPVAAVQLLAVVVSDTVVVSEDPTVSVGAEPPREISVADSVVVTDSPGIEPLELALVTVDAVSLAEAISSLLPFQVIAVADAVSLSDSPSGHVTLAGVSVSEVVTVVETPVVAVQAPSLVLSIAVSDAVGVTEAVFCYVFRLDLDVSIEDILLGRVTLEDTSR